MQAKKPLLKLFKFPSEVFCWYVPLCFILIIIIGAITIGLFVLCPSYPKKHELIENVISLITLIFAMIVGYYAFEEFRTKRIENYKKEGEKYTREMRLELAKQCYESAYNLGDKTKYTLNNLSELCSMFEEFKKARKIAEEADGQNTSYDDRVIYHYLIILSYLGEKKINKAGKEIELLFKTSKGQPAKGIGWDFKQVKEKMIKSMGTKGKKILEIMENFMGGKLSPDEFERQIKEIGWLT